MERSRNAGAENVDPNSPSLKVIADHIRVNQISANYLSTLVLQTAGLPLTQYNRYLASLYQKLPIINTVGYVDADNNYYTHSENSKYDDLLYQYHCLVYNSLIDRNNRDSSVFFMNQ